MSNICSTNITFYSTSDKGKKILKEFREKLIRILEQAQDGNDYGGYLSIFAKEFGIKETGEFLRGEIIEIEDYYGDIYGDAFEIMQADANLPRDDLWRDIINKNGWEEDINFVYIASESGCGVFVNTDDEGRFYDELYHLSLCDEANDFYEEQSFSGACDLIDYVQDKVREFRDKHPKLAKSRDYIEFVNNKNLNVAICISYLKQLGFEVCCAEYRECL